MGSAPRSARSPDQPRAAAEKLAAGAMPIFVSYGASEPGSRSPSLVKALRRSGASGRRTPELESWQRIGSPA